MRRKCDKQNETFLASSKIYFSVNKENPKEMHSRRKETVFFKNQFTNSIDSLLKKHP